MWRARSHLRAAIAVFAFGAGCAARAFPVPIEPDSAASVTAPAGEPSRVDGVLSSDPPLPGEPLGDFHGLEEPPAETHPHSHEHEHGGDHGE